MIRMNVLAATLALAAATFLSAACSVVPRATALPDTTALFSGSCACREDGDCIALEAVAGRTEVRNASCRWVVEGYKAGCSFESRFIMEFSVGAEEPGAWSASRVILRPSRVGGWCKLSGA